MRQSNASSTIDRRRAPQSGVASERPRAATTSRGVATWSPGDTVKVGYMTLLVVRRIPTPGDGKPDKWAMQSLDGYRDYEFAPYAGLRLVADRRPAPSAKGAFTGSAGVARPPKPVAVRSQESGTTRQEIRKATTDGGKGRDVRGEARRAATPRELDVAHTPIPTAADLNERMDRIERLLGAVAESLHKGRH